MSRTIVRKNRKGRVTSISTIKMCIRDRSVPYSADYELTMDILRYGANVEVLAPEGLRRRVEEQLRAAANRYQVPST